MIIECEEDPWELIQEVGDPLFSICDETWDEIYRHPNHPHTLRIIDCESNQTIDITAETIEDTRRMAEALCKLPNTEKNFEEGIVWGIYWKDEWLPFTTPTKNLAIAIALSCHKLPMGCICDE